MKIIAHDTVNDIAILVVQKKVHEYYVRYGLEITKCVDLADAVNNFQSKVDHALECEGYYD